MNDDFRDDDMDFDFDDDFNFDDDDPFSGGGGSGDRGYSQDDDDFNFDDDESIDFEDIDALSNFDDSDDLSFTDEEQSARGTNRTFIILAVLMFLTFLCGIGLVLFLALRPTGPSPTALTATQIAAENEATIIAATEMAILRATTVAETQAAIDAEQTSTAIALQTEIPITETAEAALTQEAATIVALTEIALSFTPTPLEVAAFDLPATQTAQAENLTLTAIATLLTVEPEIEEDTPTPPPISQPLLAEDVALTATAIAEALRGGIPTPTPEDLEAVGPITQPPTTGVPGDRLPETGLFDDLTSDQGLLMALLIALGLVGVIAVSRTIRTTNA